jgi:hypothetical protein
LANIVLNFLDWRLHEHGLRLVRYADDCVVLCQTRTQAEEALLWVKQTLSQLGLALSAEKTRITTYGKGYSFLGFVLSRRSRPACRQRFIGADLFDTPELFKTEVEFVVEEPWNFGIDVFSG